MTAPRTTAASRRGRGACAWPRWLLALCATTLALTTLLAGARADDATDHFRAGTDALSLGSYQDAIDNLEAYADREPPHPDASFNRAMAYLMRVRAGAERPGDVGRAAAALEETLAMRPGDVEAAAALELVRGEVARRRSRRGKEAMLVRPTLDRVVLHLASERSWAVAAIAAAMLLALGLLLRRRPAGAAQLAGTLLAPACAVAVLVLMPLYLGAHQLRLHSRPAVLVVREAFLSDEQGVRQGSASIPEAALLEASERRGRMLAVRYGNVEGWVPAAAVQLLRTR